MRVKNVRLRGPRVTIRPLRKRDLDVMSSWETFEDPLYRLFDWPRRGAVENGLWYADLVRDRRRVATTLGFGPRFLHSTGQLHKGGPNSGGFLKITGRKKDLRPFISNGSRASELEGAMMNAQPSGWWVSMNVSSRIVLSAEAPSFRRAETWGSSTAGTCFFTSLIDPLLRTDRIAAQPSSG